MALRKPAINIDITKEQGYLTDGDSSTYTTSHPRAATEDASWFEVDLQEDQLIELVGIINVPVTGNAYKNTSFLFYMYFKFVHGYIEPD